MATKTFCDHCGEEIEDDAGSAKRCRQWIESNTGLLVVEFPNDCYAKFLLSHRNTRQIDACPKCFTSVLLYGTPALPPKIKAEQDAVMGDAVVKPLLEATAQEMYEAYGEAAHWKNFQGNPMPKWASLPGKIQSYWVAAATVAVR